MTGVQAACDIPIPSSQYIFNVPSWQAQNFSCTGPPEVFAIRPSPGKGLGAFVTRSLEPGTLIMQEAPLIKVYPPEIRDGVGYPLDTIQRLVREAFEALSEDGKAEILALSAHIFPHETTAADYDPLLPIFRSNSFNTGDFFGLFPKVARINHSCRPNTAYYWNERLRKRVVYATRRVEEGEELSLSYIPLLHTKADRELRLNQYGFKCTCEVCSAAANDIMVSDQRREQIRRAIYDLESELTVEVPADKATRRKAQKQAEESLKLLRLVEEEELAVYYAQVYRIAALSHARLEKWEPATIWAHKSYQLRQMADEQSQETIEMKILTSRFIESWNEDLRNKSMKSGRPRN
ncbi:SET domain-containing protein [Zopfia rhizophila CBS 207.26]|uniref:SET domain-containing protein n=1 Tax=Zopfia rhizophila CBS 207.26 TaxID=1314779 RepID=A0A6A6EP47_9PEZI|nr:SET domain-containing protein [Zopfia rhizophila CBS 207.26]